MSSQDKKNENVPKFSAAISNKVMNAVLQLQGTKGVSLPELKKFLKNSKNFNVSEADPQIRLAIQKNLDKGILIKDGRNYKVKEAKRGRGRSKSRSKGRKRSKSRRSPAKGRKRSRKSGRSKGRKSGARKSRKRKSTGRRRRTAPAAEPAAT